LIIYGDNARSHMARISLPFLDKNDMTIAPYPPYSPDLAPSDFFVFGHIKQLFRGAEFPDRDSPFDAIAQILTVLEKVTLNDLFLSWMDQLRGCVAAHGDYIE
jgi:hypothetical protein